MDAANITGMLRRHIMIIVILISGCSVFAQEGRLIRTELFSIPTSRFSNASGYSFKIAVNSKDEIALNACSQPYVYIYNLKGEQTDSVKLPFTSCVRTMEFDENDNLLIMDNDELNIYTYNFKYRKLEGHPYQKPEDW